MLALESQDHCLPFLLKSGKKYIEVFQAARTFHTQTVALSRKLRWEKMFRLKYHTLKTHLLQGNDYKVLLRNGSTVWLTCSSVNLLGLTSPGISSPKLQWEKTWHDPFCFPVHVQRFFLVYHCPMEERAPVCCVYLGAFAERVSNFLRSHIDLPNAHRSILYGKMWHNSS